jgi:peptidyl-dipeptidase A
MRSVVLVILWGAGPLALAQTTSQAASGDEQEFAALLKQYLARYEPLFVESATAGWVANISGSEADYARKKAADRALIDLHSDREMFAVFKRLREKRTVREPVLRRQLDIVYRSYLENQTDPALRKRIVELESEVEQTFNTFRAKVGERSLTENEIRETLAQSTESKAVEAAWKGYMEVGVACEPKLRELVRMRNEVARSLGYRNYYALALELQEIDETELLRIFDDLDNFTRKPFAQLKADMDRTRAARFKIAEKDLRPWHYGDLFFQEAPTDAEVDLDELFAGAKLEELAKEYYSRIGLPVDEILAKSDLYEKPGKCPHAFCVNIDRRGDMRILTNLKPNMYWAGTIMHELGHAIYDRNARSDLPFLLRTCSHSMTTEGVAELFGAMAKNEEWLREVAKVPADKAAEAGAAARAALRTERLMFARWAQVMLHFEREMYTRPDQDLAKLWWDLKKKFQLLNPPDRMDRPDYAAKIHVVTTPVYYHNYLLGECFAAQVRQALVREVLRSDDGLRSSFYHNPEVGAWLKDKVLGPGALYSWNELTRRATGETLTPQYFVTEAIGKEGGS